MNGLMFALLLLYSTVGVTATVYKTVDDNGVVSFSDTPPAAGAPTEVLQITPPTAQSPEEYLENLEAMRETTDRLVADRQEREKHRAEMKEIKARTQPYQVAGQPGYSQYADYYPGYSQRYRRIGHPPWRPGYRPRPEHPIVRPPVGPGHVFTGSNSQLMRPIVSSRR